MITKASYFVLSGMIAGIGAASFTDAFYPIEPSAAMIISTGLYVGIGFAMYHYDDEICKYLGVTE